MDNTRKELKNRLRSDIRARREALGPEEAKRLSEAAGRTLLTHPLLQHECVVASYLDANAEISTDDLNLSLISMGHVLALPLIDFDRKGHIDFYRVQHLEDLTENRFGIREPVADRERLIPFNLFEMVIVPLVAFDSRGNRLGMGGGYYDRLLKKLSSECLTMGIAYDFQEVDKIDYESWDMPLDEVVTPTRHLNFSGKCQC